MAFVGPDGLIQLDDFMALLRRPAWFDDALCREPAYAGLSFFPERGQSVVAAKAVCSRCAVQAECIAFAFNMGERNGIWGGLSERERRDMRSKDSTLRVDPSITAFRKASRGLAPGPARAKCGTESGERTHRNRGETPCDECKAARRAADARRAAEKRQRSAA